MRKIIYADNAATTHLDPDAYAAMQPYLCDEYGNASGLYSFAHNPKKAISNARTIIASCIGANVDEIYFTSGGTEGDNWAIKGFALKNHNIGKHIITSAIEHHAVLKSCSFLEELDFNVSYLPVDQNGTILPNSLQNALRPDTILVSIMLANNEVGTIQRINELAKISHFHGCVFHSDAVQAVGHLPINVKELGTDILVASAHKFNGPKGTGFIYIKKGIGLYNWLSGGAQENGFRAGTENVAGIVGMAAALQKNVEHISENMLYLNRLSRLFLEKISEANIDYVLNGNPHDRIPGNINISVKGIAGEALLHRLDLKNIAVSTGAACNSVNPEPSHVIKEIGTPQEYATGTIRISFGKDNTENEVLTIAEAIVEIISRKG